MRVRFNRAASPKLCAEIVFLNSKLAWAAGAPFTRKVIPRTRKTKTTTLS